MEAAALASTKEIPGSRIIRVGPTAAIPGFAFAEILAARTNNARPDNAPPAPPPVEAGRDQRPATTERTRETDQNRENRSRDSAPTNAAGEASDLPDDSLPLPDTATRDTGSGDHASDRTGSDDTAPDGNEQANTDTATADDSATGDGAGGDAGEAPVETDAGGQPVVTGPQTVTTSATIPGAALPGSGQQNGTAAAPGASQTTGAVDPATTGAAATANTGAVDPANTGAVDPANTGDTPGPVITTGPGNSQGQGQTDETGGRHQPTLPGNASPVARLATYQGGQAVAAAAQAGTLPKSNGTTGQTTPGTGPAAATATGEADGEAGQTGLPLLADGDGDGEHTARPGTQNSGPANRTGGIPSATTGQQGQVSGSEGQTPAALPAAEIASQTQASQILAAVRAFADPATTGSDGMRTAVDPLAQATGGTNGPLTADSVSRAAAQAAATRSGGAHSPVAEQVAVRIQKAIAEGMDRIQIRLNPASLGRINISMELAHDGRVIAVVAVDNPETLEILKQDSQGLQRALQDAGLQADSDSLSFTMNGGDEDLAGDGFSHAAGPDADAPDSIDSTTTGRMISGRGLVDIHV